MPRGSPERDRHPGSTDAGAWPLAAALAGVFLLKLAVLRQLGDHPLLQPGGGLDADAYHQLARRVAGGDLLLGPGLYFVSPLYIYFQAAALAISGGSLGFVRLLQIALGTAGCGLLWLTAREWFGARAAWLALLLAALTGVFTFYEILLLQAALDPFLTALDLWCLTLALRRDWKWGGAAGAALAVHVLNRPNLILWGSGLALMLFARPGTRKTAAAGLLGAAVALAPLAARNLAAAGTLAPVPSHGGLNFYIGNNPRADGTYRRVEGITPNIAGQAEDARRIAERAEGRPLTDAEVSAHFTRRALAWWRDEPLAAARLLARKIGYTLNASFLTLNYSYPFYRGESSALRALVVGPWLLIPIGVVGLFAHRLRGGRPPAGFVIFGAAVPWLVLSVAIFFVASRYRLPLLVALCVPAAGLLDACWRNLRARRAAPLAFAFAALVPLAVLGAWDFGLDDGRMEEQTRLAVWLAANGRGHEAERHAAAIPGDSPLAGVSHFRIGQALEQEGDLARAVASYRRATAVDPAEPAPRAALARAAGRLGVQLAQQQRDEEALRLLAEAARLAPADAAAQLNLGVQLARMGRVDEARAAAARALAIDPGYERAKEFLKAIGTKMKNEK